MHEQLGRGSGDGGLTPRVGGRYFGETVDGAKVPEPRRESAVLICTFFNACLLSSMAQRAQPLASKTFLSTLMLAFDM